MAPFSALLLAGLAWAAPSPAELLERAVPEKRDSQWLAKHYRLSTGEEGPAWTLTLAPPQPGLSRVFWFDAKTGALLRSEQRLADGKPLPQGPKRRPFVSDPPPQEVARAGRESGLSPALPGWLPEGWAFKSLELMDHKGKRLIHWRFSDGTHTLSHFQCPARTRLAFGSKEKVAMAVAGGKGQFSWTPHDHVLGWSAGGSRFVLIAPLPPEVLRRVAESVREP